MIKGLYLLKFYNLTIISQEDWIVYTHIKCLILNWVPYRLYCHNYFDVDSFMSQTMYDLSLVFEGIRYLLLERKMFYWRVDWGFYICDWVFLGRMRTYCESSVGIIKRVGKRDLFFSFYVLKKELCLKKVNNLLSCNPKRIVESVNYLFTCTYVNCEVPFHSDIFLKQDHSKLMA